MIKKNETTQTVLHDKQNNESMSSSEKFLDDIKSLNELAINDKDKIGLHAELANNKTVEANSFVKAVNLKSGAKTDNESIHKAKGVRIVG